MLKKKFRALVLVSALLLTSLPLLAFAQDPGGIPPSEIQLILKPGEEKVMEGVLVCIDCELLGRRGAEAQNFYGPGHTHALKLADGQVIVFVAPTKNVQEVLDQHKLNLEKVKVRGRVPAGSPAVHLLFPAEITGEPASR